MPIEIEQQNDVTNAKENVKGSDSRLNTSSRSDHRIYYNSRDKSQAFSFPFDDANCSPGDYIASLFNNKTDGSHLVIQRIGVNAEAAASFKLALVTGTAGGGAVAATPFRLNRAGQVNTATVTASTVVDSDTTPITGLSESAVIDHESLTANGHAEFQLNDTLRLGQDQGIAIEHESGSAGTRAFGVVFFYFEKVKD